MLSLTNCHPAVSMVYFLSVLLITMFTANPVLIGLALLGGMVYTAMLLPLRGFWSFFGVSLPLFFIIAAVNPLFSHNGVTELFFLNGNPVTLEAILYGLNLAAMLMAVLYWFTCFNRIMTSDRLLFLLGKGSPKIALLLSSALRFIPLLKEQAQKIRQTQRAMGLFSSEGWLERLKGTVRVYSALLTWSLENAAQTGASMKARGYGLGRRDLNLPGRTGRSHFTLWRFTGADGLLLFIILVFDGAVLWGMAAGALNALFYPRLLMAKPGPHAILAYAAFGLLTFLPGFLEGKERLQWNYYRSKI